MCCRDLSQLMNLLWLQVKIFENLAGVDRQWTTQLDQKLLTAVSQNGNVIVNEEKSSTITSEPLLHVDDPLTTVQRKDVDSISRTSGSAIPSPNVQEVDYPSKDLEQQIWMDRVNDSAKGSTSSSGSSVQSPARLAKPPQPAPASAKKKRVVVGNGATNVVGAQIYPSHSSAIGEIDKDDTMQLYSQETDAESDLDRALSNARKQLAAGDTGAAQTILQRVSSFMRIRFMHGLSCVHAYSLFCASDPESCAGRVITQKYVLCDM